MTCRQFYLAAQYLASKTLKLEVFGVDLGCRPLKCFNLSSLLLFPPTMKENTNDVNSGSDLGLNTVFSIIEPLGDAFDEQNSTSRSLTEQLDLCLNEVDDLLKFCCDEMNEGMHFISLVIVFHEIDKQRLCFMCLQKTFFYCCICDCCVSAMSGKLKLARTLTACVWLYCRHQILIF